MRRRKIEEVDTELLLELMSEFHIGAVILGFIGGFAFALGPDLGIQRQDSEGYAVLVGLFSVGLFLYMLISRRYIKKRVLPEIMKRARNMDVD